MNKDMNYESRLVSSFLLNSVAQWSPPHILYSKTLELQPPSGLARYTSRFHSLLNGIDDALHRRRAPCGN